MSYTPFNWLPRLGQGLNKFTDQTTGQVLTLNSTPDSITQEGTPFSAARMNALEQGLGNVFNKPEQLTAAVAALFGFPASAVPNDIFNLLSAAALYKESPSTGLYDVLGNLLLSLPGVQIETGSYVGTGTYGSSNPNSLTFGFEIKFVWIVATLKSDNDYFSYPSVYPPEVPYVLCDSLTTEYRKSSPYSGGSAHDAFAKKSSDGKTIYWYNRYSEDAQFNSDNYYYYYIAIG